MATINQLVSEIAHAIHMPDSIPARRAIKLGIIHARNELIRKSFENHKVTDKVLQQRFRLALTDVPDGDIYNSKGFVEDFVKRTVNKVPRPTRLTNNLPFHSVRTAGVVNPIEIPFVKEATSKYYSSLPGMCVPVTYDYINEYIYINVHNAPNFAQLGSIIVESVFEYPHIIPIETNDTEVNVDAIDDNDEFLLPEDMITAIKQTVLATFNPNVVLDSNEIPSSTKVR
jgi:hypothetical protein